MANDAITSVMFSMRTPAVPSPRARKHDEESETRSGVRPGEPRAFDHQQDHCYRSESSQIYTPLQFVAKALTPS
jgi:hypothetical protein